MNALKALLLAGLITSGIMLVIFWIIPVLIFVIIFGAIAVVAYAIFEDNKQRRPPP